MRGLDGLLTIEEAAERTGFVVGTLRNLKAAGIFPPPRVRVGVVGFYHPEDIAYFKKSYTGRPASRYSFRYQRRGSRKAK